MAACTLHAALNAGKTGVETSRESANILRFNHPRQECKARGAALLHCCWTR